MSVSRLRLNILSGLACAILGLAGARPAIADADLDAWDSHRNSIQSWTSHMKVLDRDRMDQVMRIVIEKRFLLVQTPLDAISSEESMRVPLPGIHGTVTVTVNHEDHGDGVVRLNRFSLNIMDFPGPKLTSSFAVLSQPGDLTLSHTSQVQSGAFRQVMFTQQKATPSNGGPLVRLQITESKGLNGAPETFSLESTDFVSFVRDHPVQTEQYLRPLLHALGQEAVFGPNQMVAWQVFSELWKPDPAVASRVNGLVPSLDADDYRIRNEALQQLQQTGLDGAAVLIHLDRASMSPEQNARIDRALRPYAQFPNKEAARLRNDPRFLLDCLYSDDASLRRTAIERLRAVVRPDLQFNVDAELEERQSAIDALAAQVLPAPTPALR